jgi:hypothetical protein
LSENAQDVINKGTSYKMFSWDGQILYPCYYYYDKF